MVGSGHTTFVFENPPYNPLACFLVQAFITLIITRACGKLVSYAKSPRVIGEIIGGVLLGLLDGVFFFARLGALAFALLH